VELVHQKLQLLELIDIQRFRKVHKQYLLMKLHS